MAATAGTMVAVGRQSRRVYTIDLYIPDATGTLLTFNPTGLATTTSQSTWRAPEDVVIVDVSIGTAPTAVGAILTKDGAVIGGGAIRWANQLQTLANRLKLALPIEAGAFVGATQF